MRRVTFRREELGRGPLALVNRDHPLEEGWTPELLPVDRNRPEVLLERRACLLLAACLRAVGGAGAILPVSGWRSLREQRLLWADTLAREGEDFTRRYVALPGCSEHQTGLAIDLGEAGEDLDWIRPAFPDRGACGAFRRAAARYGFVQRYRREKEAITGIAEEPWHFRYVGTPHALLMEDHGLCLEEYGDFVRERPRRVELDSGLRATVSHLPFREETVELPEGCFQLSGDNVGGIFLTRWETS